MKHITIATAKNLGVRMYDKNGNVSKSYNGTALKKMLYFLESGTSIRKCYEEYAKSQGAKVIGYSQYYNLVRPFEEAMHLPMFKLLINKMNKETVTRKDAIRFANQITDLYEVFGDAMNKLEVTKHPIYDVYVDADGCLTISQW